MDAIRLTDELVKQGFSRDELGRLCRTGELHHVRRGAYAQPGAPALTPIDVHRQLIRATVPQLQTNAVVSHVSAAVVHGLPVWDCDLHAVHLTRPRTAGGGKKRTLVRLHGQPLDAADVTEVDGIPVTSLARTIFDLGRTFPFEKAVAAGDRALAIGMALEILADLLQRGRRWVGIGQARRVAGFIDPRAESAGESVSRVRCHQLSLPKPEPQLPVTLRDGRVAYADLGWRELGTLGEFDGKVKYEKLLKPGESPADAVIREKRREDMLRDLGWQIVRWIWADLYRFGPVRDQLLAAFARGRAVVIT